MLEQEIIKYCDRHIELYKRIEKSVIEAGSSGQGAQWVIEEFELLKNHIMILQEKEAERKAAYFNEG